MSARISSRPQIEIIERPMNNGAINNTNGRVSNHVAREASHTHTFHGLAMKKEALCHKAGSVIIDAESGLEHNLSQYIEELIELKLALKYKLDQTRNEDKADDLQIMHDKIKILKDHMESYQESLIVIRSPARKQSTARR